MNAFTEWLDKIEAQGIKAFGKVQLELKPPLVMAAHCRLAMKYAAPGVIIARKYKGHLASLAIPGSYSHTGVCESTQYMIHAVGEGVGRVDVLDFVKDCDGFIMVRPKEPFDLNKGIEWLRQQIGKPYDFKFDGMDASSLFCHETAAGYCNEGGLKMLPVRTKLGPIERDIFTADQFLDWSRFERVYVTEF